ncbi:MAG: STAS domain-containing protein [Acidimicrobiales bacterium]
MDPFHRAMTIAVDETGRARVEIGGDVDAGNAEGLRLAILDAASKSGAKLEVDLAGITFMDSSGLRAIADASRELESPGSGLALFNVPRQVLRLLAITVIGADLEVNR